MQTTNYTSLYQALNDVNVHIKLLSGQSLTLANIQAVASARWTWIVDNWAKRLSAQFKTFANGDQSLEAKYADFQRFITSYNLGNKTNPLDTLQNFVQVAPFLDLIPLNTLSLSPDEAALRDVEIDRISNMSIEDFRNIIRFLRVQSATFAQTVGLGDADAAKLLGIQQAKKQRGATIQDLEQIEQINDLRRITETLLYRALRSQKRPPNVVALSNQFIDPASTVFFDSSFKSYTPVPFEISLEHMAQKYLGNRQFWFELVTINNLQPPYIDEKGTKYPLLAPGAANNLLITSVQAHDIPVGTKISIGSSRYREESRVIERAIRNEDGTMIIFLSGLQDINRFKPSENAFVRIYAPHTARSGNFILIPSRSQSGISTSVPTPSSDELRRLDKALLQFGVDIAHDERTNDWVFDQTGNFKKAAGLRNVKQAVLNALQTTRGELPFHPRYGVSIDIGGRFFGTTDEALIFGELLRETLLRDARLRDVRIQRVEATGTGIALTLLVTIAGATQPLPLSFIS